MLRGGDLESDCVRKEINNTLLKRPSEDCRRGLLRLCFGRGHAVLSAS